MLAARLKEEAHLTQKEIKVIEQPFYVSEDTYAPRYYQQVAVDRALGAIARGQQRILLVMATGTGTTYTAFQIIYRLRKAGLQALG